ncbi:MFS transporter [Plantactinospora siamensis]|uniref:MFS transporter n=1 Tax=Plantactinospora siamensis TaxID=555372 RepID=A0ABV6NXA1_9ACTN
MRAAERTQRPIERAASGRSRRRRRSLGADFDRLWHAYAVSTLGSAVGSGALPLVAVLVLHASALRVSLLAAVSGLASAVILFPLGPRIDARRKRPIMVISDLVRCAALLSVPLAAAAGLLTYPQLLIVGVVQTAATLTFTAASGAHLKGLLPPGDRAEGNARLESVFWLAQSSGPPVGGVLVGWFGGTVTLLVDALSYLVSAAWIRRIRRPETTPSGAMRAGATPAPGRAGVPGRYAELTAGWRYLLGHADLRMLFWNSLLFGGPVMLVSPLLAVLMLRELGLAAWEYGLALGVPCLGAVLGARLAPPLTRRLGLRRMLLLFGALRAPWLVLLAFTPAGPAGLPVILLAETGLLFGAGGFNPSFATFRLAATEDRLMARVLAAWSTGSKVAQPLFIAAGGLLAAATSTRLAIGVAGLLCAASTLLLPWRATAAGADPVASV